MTHPDRQTAARDLFEVAFSYVVHSLTALLIAPPVCMVLAGVAPNWLASWLAKDISFWSVVVVVGVILGYVANRVTLGGTACWVWMPGLIWLLLGLWDSVRLYDPRWHQGCSAVQNVVNAFFVADSGKCGGAEDLSAVIFALPAFCSAAYSVGAWIELRTRRSGKSTVAPVHPTEECR
jgi:hypothetical protein